MKELFEAGESNVVAFISQFDIQNESKISRFFSKKKEKKLKSVSSNNFSESQMIPDRTENPNN